jgi:hypothetical protein
LWRSLLAKGDCAEADDGDCEPDGKWHAEIQRLRLSQRVADRQTTFLMLRLAETAT